MWLIQRIAYLLIILAAALIGTATWRKQGGAFRALLLLLWTTFFFESAAVWLAYHGRNSFLYHLFNPIECLLWGLVYYGLFTLPAHKKIIVFLCGGAFLFMIINSLLIQQFQYAVNYYSITAENAFLLFASLFYFRDMLHYPAEGNVLKFSSFWLNCAVLFFYTINILFWISYGFLKSHSKAMLHAGFQLDIYSNYVLYIVLGYAIILESRRPKNEPSPS